MNLRPSFVFVVCASLVGLSLACSGKTVGSEGPDSGGGADAAPSSDGGGMTAVDSGGDGSVCDDFYTAAYSGSCVGYVAPPASEVARDRPRFDEFCESLVALPGSNVTASGLAACLAAIKTSGCWVLNANEAPCDFAAGTGAAGMACAYDGQCASDCSAGSETPDGGTLVCGTCEATPGVGQTCTGLCDSGAVCVMTSGPTGTCETITYGASGAACDSQARQCGPGLVCSPSAQTCGPPGGVGASCETQSDCQPGLVCPPPANTCAEPGQSGASCGSDVDCAIGLGCDFDDQKCATVTWVATGQPCSSIARCTEGRCSTTGSTSSGTCSAPVPDGQPCTNDFACDAFASCIGGTCVLSYAGRCP